MEKLARDVIHNSLKFQLYEMSQYVSISPEMYSAVHTETTQDLDFTGRGAGENGKKKDGGGGEKEKSGGYKRSATSSNGSGGGGSGGSGGGTSSSASKRRKT